MARPGEADVSSHNRISSGTVVDGNITATSDVRFDGILNGSIRTKGKLVLGESGKVKGEVFCSNSDIEGSLEGKIHASGLLFLKASADVKGDIITARLAIEPGARFSGSCNMNDAQQKNDQPGPKEGQPVATK